MADPWKTEFHVLDPKDGQSIAWFEEDDREDAIDEARRIGGKVEEVISYLEDRRIVWPPEDDEDE